MSRIGKKVIPLPSGVKYKVEGNTVLVRGLDCLDETPLLDIKPDRCEFSPLSAPQPGDFEME